MSSPAGLNNGVECKDSSQDTQLRQGIVPDAKPPKTPPRRPRQVAFTPVV